MIKHLTVLIAFLVAVGTPATSADTVCTLSSSVKSSTADNPDKLIIRRNDLNIKAILMTKYFTKVYNCTDAIVDEYECFGFHDKPFEAPMQLNVGDTKAGATVVAATLNLGFLGAYAAGGYTPSDYITRRFSIDSYTIESCRATGSQATSNIESRPSSGGEISYFCDGKTYIIIGTETGWALLNEPYVEVSTTYDGFMLEDHETGTERSLGTLASGADVMYVYDENGTRRYDCVSIRDQ